MMTEREKIIETIKKNGTYNGRSLSFDYYVIQPDDLADALIAAGYGDVEEAKRKAFVYSKEIAYLDKKLKETKHRAEVALRACLIATDKIYDYCYEEAIAQAERELTEGKKQ